MTDPTPPVEQMEPTQRAREMTHQEQMVDAQNGCIPCKLCGGKAIISDAGTGRGYFIRCENSHEFRKSTGCMLDERRLSGWAYNVRDWWNRLHAATRDTLALTSAPVERADGLDAEMERLGESLFTLSDRLRRIGALESDNVHAAYEAVVAQFQRLDALHPAAKASGSEGAK